MAVPVVTPLEHAGQDAYLVRLATLRGVFGLARPAPVQVALQIRFRKR